MSWPSRPWWFRFWLTFQNLPAATYTVRIRYQAWTPQQNDVLIDGVSRSESFPATGEAWTVKTITGVALGAGMHSIAISKDWGYMNVDWVEVTS